MAQFKVNATRIDPYKNFRFVISWDGQPVAGVSHVSGIGRTTDVVEHREGGDPIGARKSPGRTTITPVTLQRGVTHDPAFEQWANKMWYWSNNQQSMATNTNGQNMSLKDFRKDINVALFNEAGQKVIAYNLYRCWPSEYEALPELDANANAIAIQKLVLQVEGWERDTSVVEPQEPSYTLPAAT